MDKVFVETNVLISASVFAVAHEVGVTLVHRFHHISEGLFDLLKRRIREKIGITTITVEHEAHSVLAKAVGDALEKAVKEEPAKRLALFDAYGAICDICSDNLERNVAVLAREPIPEEERSKYYEKVSQMYDLLSEQMEKLMSPEKYAEAMVKGYGPRRLKGTAFKIYREQYEAKYRQIMRLKERPVDPVDKQILVEAAYLKSIYKNAVLYFASTDYHFSPYRYPDGRESRIISDEIERCFGIICDFPDAIMKKLS